VRACARGPRKRAMPPASRIGATRKTLNATSNRRMPSVPNPRDRGRFRARDISMERPSVAAAMRGSCVSTDFHDDASYSQGGHYWIAADCRARCSGVRWYLPSDSLFVCIRLLFTIDRPQPSSSPRRLVSHSSRRLFQYRRIPAEILARRSSRCSAHAFFVAAAALSRPSVVLRPVNLGLSHARTRAHMCNMSFPQVTALQSLKPS